MRTWLYNRLTNMPELPAPYRAAGKVISSGAANAPAAPFIVATIGVEQPFPGMPREARAQEIPFTLWLHDTPGSMLQIDDGAVALQKNLPTEDGFMIGTMSVMGIRWTETGEDAYDDHFKTNCRPVRFSMVTAH